VEKISPDSVVEIDTEVTIDGDIFFTKFSMALKQGVCPYLSID
jgi:hypothetical protein